MAREDFAVRGMMPEMNPYEVSPLAVQGPVAAQPSYAPGSLDDLSQFGGLGAIGEYRPDFSGAFGGSGSPVSPQGVPTSYAFPENYGNPKNKIYQLSAAPGEGVRLKAVDGTVLFEGQGPEAAAKAASIVQELGKQFGTQSTWVLDKQPVGGDWKQVSQDTVGEKKTTAVNAFLNVAAPIAGALLTPFIPGIGQVLSAAGQAAVGAGGGSLINSALQNKNSAQAMKDAAIAAAGSYIGAKIAPSVTGAFKGLSPAADLATNTIPTVGTQATGALAKAGTDALTKGLEEIVITGARNGLTTGLGAGFGAGAGSLIPKPNLNVDQYKVNDFKVDPAKPTTPTDPVIDELVVTGTRTTPIDKLVSSTGSAFTGSDFGKTLRDTTTLAETPAEKPNEVTTPNDAELVVTGPRLAPGFDPSIAGAGLGAGLGGVVQPAAPPVKPTIDPIEEIVVTAKPKVDVGALTGAAVQVPVTTPAPNPTIEELVVTAKKKPEPEKPLVPTPVILPDGTLNPDFVNKDITVDNPEGTTDTKPEPKNPLGVIKDVLPLVGLVGGLGGAGGSGGSGGSGVNTLGYPGGNQPGTPGSLGGVFTSKLPTPNPALAVTPRDMGQRDWLRYGFGPEASFFSNVPEPKVEMAKGGSTGGTSHKPRTEFAVHGAGTGRSDDIPAVLSDGEYVMDAETVALLGDGSSKAGAEKLDQLRVNLRRHKGANLAKGRFSVNAKSPEKYLTGGRV